MANDLPIPRSPSSTGAAFRSNLRSGEKPESYKTRTFKNLRNAWNVHLAKGDGKDFRPVLRHMEMAALSDPSVGTADILSRIASTVPGFYRD